MQCKKLKYMNANSKHMTFWYYDKDHNPVYKSKKAYNSEHDALIAAFNINIRPETIKKIVAYKCPVCNKWHLGHNNTILSTYEKNKIKERFKFLLKNKMI